MKIRKEVPDALGVQALLPRTLDRNKQSYHEPAKTRDKGGAL